MGHVHLGSLPQTRPWQRVVSLLAGGAHAEQVANATVRAAERILGRAYHDTGLVETLWFLFQLPRAARTEDFPDALRRCGVDVPSAPELMDLLAGLTAAIDARLPNNHGRTDLGEMAQMALVETFAAVVSRETHGLFGTSPDEVQGALARLATTRQYGHLGRQFFARLIFKFLDFYLSRALADHVGQGKRFVTLAQVAAFGQALETHCGEAAVVVEVFTGEWFSKHQWESGGNVTRKLVAAFAHGAMQKLIEELKRRVRTHA